MSKRAKIAAAVALLALLPMLGCTGLLNDLLIACCEGGSPSKSHGPTHDGRLEHGKRMPSGGANFRTYSGLGSLIGRTATHSAVRDTLLDAYRSLHDSHPDRRFVYGELGWPAGGPFRPHRTHQNGLSVDLMVPVVDADDGSPDDLHTHLLAGFGYGLDFDDEGRGVGFWNRGQQIHWQGLGAMLLAVEEAAGAHGLRVQRVILAPQLRKELLREVEERRLRRLPWLRRGSWVRHDDHVHIDFERR